MASAGFERIRFRFAEMCFPIGRTESTRHTPRADRRESQTRRGVKVELVCKQITIEQHQNSKRKTQIIIEAPTGIHFQNRINFHANFWGAKANTRKNQFLSAKIEKSTRFAFDYCNFVKHKIGKMLGSVIFALSFRTTQHMCGRRWPPKITSLHLCPSLVRSNKKSSTMRAKPNNTNSKSLPWQGTQRTYSVPTTACSWMEMAHSAPISNKTKNNKISPKTESVFYVVPSSGSGA